MNDIEFIETLKQKRNACDYSQSRLAQELQISRQNLNEIENGKTKASKEMKHILLHYLDYCNCTQPFTLTIDYLRVRFPTTDALEIIKNVLAMKSEYFIHEDYGMFGYEEQYIYGDISVNASKDSSMGVLLELRGMGCRNLEYVLQARGIDWYYFLSSCIDYQGVFKRIQQAIIERASHPAFGYFEAPPEYYKAIIRWQETRHGVTGLKPRHIGYENGVLGGVISALNCICSRGDNVLVHSPTYIGFTSSLKNNGYEAVHSPLVRDENGIWRMDYADMEKQLREKKIHAAILCNPHNPCGRVWERRELEKAMELYRKYDVYVISDEIWSDLILNGHKHIPSQSISEDARQRTAAFYAPSKTFNLAGLVGSYHIVYNSWWRDRILKESSLSHYNMMNVLSMHALLGAYQPEGYEWTDELCEVLSGNVSFACDYIDRHFKGVNVSRPEGTYMLFADCTDWCTAHGKTIEDVEKACWDVGVAVQDGRMFFGPCHLRMNLASPRSRIEEAFRRMDRYVFNR